MDFITAVSEEFLVDVPGGHIFAQKWTPSESKDPIPLFLLHDSLGSVELWRDFPQKLSETLGKIVIAYDRLGFGKSSARSDLPTKRFIEEEAELYFPKVRSATEAQKFDLFGHSVGGTMALICAGKIPGCRSVVTESSQSFIEERTRQGIRRAKQEFQDPKNFARLVKYHGEKAAWVLKAWTDIWLAEDFAQWNLASDLSQVHCPVLAIHGDRDEYGSEAFPRMIHELSAGFSEVALLPDCGHVPHREKLETVLKLLIEFYQKIEL